MQPAQTEPRPSRPSAGTLALAVALLIVLCLVVALPAVAASTTSGAGSTSKKKGTASSVRFIDAPSAETPAAREKRLKRECKGRPNAGACLGMTGR